MLLSTHSTISILLTIINGTFKWYALHQILVPGSLRVPFIVVCTTTIVRLWTRLLFIADITG